MFYFIKKIHLFFVILFLLQSLCIAQNNSFGLKLIYVSSSKIYLFPESSDLILRKKHLPIENIWGVSFEYRRSFNEAKFGIGMNVDYIRKTIGPNTFNTKDGFWALPIEITAYFFIPLGIENWKIFMGGGAGTYLGGRLLTQEITNQISSEFTPGFGIHILGGIEYLFFNNFAIQTKMKFRDLYFKTNNKYYSYQNGINNNLSSDYKSRVSIDGMIVELGLLYSF